VAAAKAPAESARLRAGLGRYLAFAAFSVVAVPLAYIASVIAAALLTAANVAAFAALILGEDGALAVIHLLGQLVFCTVLGYLVAATWQWARTNDAEANAMLVIVGSLAALAFTFGFPAFVASYLPDVALWIAEGDSGVPSVALAGAFEGLVVAAAVAVARAISAQ
jgi:hypothetical protein